MKNKGFTLIEFLVSIAIIGALAMVIFRALDSTRAKGLDSGIKSQLTSLRNGFELYFNDPAKGNNSYGEPTISCDNMFADPSVSPTIEDLNNETGGNVACITIGDKWGVSVKLKTSGFYCIDSMGFSRAKTMDGHDYDSLMGPSDAPGYPALDISTSLCR
jgi:prepilin-type N-terminal cleavage/methylation domain-containing protein